MSRKSKAAEFIDQEYSLNIIGRNVLVTDAMKQYALDKLAKIEKFDMHIIDIAITMDIRKTDHCVDIKLVLDRILIKSHAVTEDMYGSIEQAFDKLQSQLRRYHDRIRSHQAKNISTIDMNVNVLRTPADQEIADLNGEIEYANNEDLYKALQPHEIVHKEKMALKTLTQAEALMKLELSGDVFLIYRGEEDRKLRLIYRRKDRNYGVVEVEA